MVPKLVYFNGKGLAELIRLLCKYGNVEFEDVRIEREQWPDLKPKTPFGQMPIWEEDGKVINQTMAIARYIAKKVELVGTDLWEDLQIDAVVDTLNDIRMKFNQAAQETDDFKKEATIKLLVDETLPYYLEKLNNMAVSGYLVAEKLTWADFYILILFDGVKRITGKSIDPKYANLYKIYENVINIPNIKNWIETRPETPF